MITQRSIPRCAKLIVASALLSLSSLPAFSQPVIGSAGATLVSESFVPANGLIDSGEVVTVSFCIQNTGTANTVNLVGTLQATGGVTSPSGPQNYGAVVAGGSPVCRNFTFTAASSSLTATIQFQDGVTNLGTVTYVFGCVLTCPANITVSNDPNQCGAVVTYPAPTGSSCGTITASPASGSFFPVGTTTVTANSASGSTCTFTVTVNDAQPPTVTCPANITQSNDPNQCGAVVTYPSATASDNCPGVTVQASPASGSFFPVGTTTVTQMATDPAGNSATCTFTVTVNDTQPPVITCPANQSVTATGPSGTVVNYPSPTVSDNCPAAAPPVCSPASGSTFPLGATSVQCTATDAAGNTATCSFTVTTTPPTIPTLSPWMLALLGLAVAAIGTIAMKLR